MCLQAGCHLHAYLPGGPEDRQQVGVFLRVHVAPVTGRRTSTCALRRLGRTQPPPHGHPPAMACHAGREFQEEQERRRQAERDFLDLMTSIEGDEDNNNTSGAGGGGAGQYPGAAALAGRRLQELQVAAEGGRGRRRRHEHECVRAGRWCPPSLPPCVPGLCGT